MFGQINANEIRNGKNNEILGKPFNFVETPTHRIGKKNPSTAFNTIVYVSGRILLLSGKQNVSEIHVSICMDAWLVCNDNTKCTSSKSES